MKLVDKNSSSITTGDDKRSRSERATSRTEAQVGVVGVSG